jgi:hypothetical protein
LKAYIIGTGSAGCRHSRILNTFGVQSIGVTQTKGSHNELSYEHSFERLIPIHKCNPQAQDLIIISSISSKHTELCKRFLSHPLIFCEKPGPNFQSKDIRILFNLRFLDVIEFFIKRKKTITSIDFIFEANAKKWHPNEDYRGSYVFNKDMGGGCILTNSHEIDLLSAFGHKLDINKIEIKETIIDQNHNELDTAFSYCKDNYSIESSIVSIEPRRIYKFKTATGIFEYNFASNQYINNSLNSVDLSFFKMWSNILESIQNKTNCLLPSAADSQFIHGIERERI